MITLLPHRRTASDKTPPASSQPASSQPLPHLASDAGQAEARLASRFSTWVLVSCLALGPVGTAVAVVALTHHQAPRPVAAAPGQNTAGVPAQEVAQQVVAAWLRSDPATLKKLVGGIDNTTLPKTRFAVRDLAPAAVSQTDTTWAVTVGATVTDARHSTARRYYQVTLAQAPSGTLSVLTLPALVSGPATTPGTTLDYRTDLSTSGAAALSVTQFLSAYLAGQGDVGVYMSPGHTAAALTPAPFRRVRLVALKGATDTDPVTSPADGTRLQVLATAEGTVTSRQVTTMTYTFTLTARAGRWEITQIDSSPVQHPTSSTTTP